MSLGCHTDLNSPLMLLLQFSMRAAHALCVCARLSHPGLFVFSFFVFFFFFFDPGSLHVVSRVIHLKGRKGFFSPKYKDNTHIRDPTKEKKQNPLVFFPASKAQLVSRLINV